MDKKAIETYAVWARKELIAQVKQRAYFYGIDEKGYGEKNADVIMGRVLSAKEKSQRNDFIVEIERRGFEQVVEEVAYTWFNRFVALRYMEVNDYLPSHVRVFSESTGRFQPEILQKALHLNLEGLDKTKVAEFLNDNATDELYRYLLLTQCNALNSALPEMFEEIDGYKELLLPNNLLKEDGLLGRLVTDIPEDNWRDAVQIIGWLYQYYNSEPKQEVFDGLKKNIKITKEKIPAATQLFTPDWIVRYMVENSLGRLWLEGHPETDLKSNWEYYLDEAEQTSEVKAQLDKIRKEYRNISPEDIKVIDPCMGSGHILVYAFDVLMQIYRSVGYTDRDAAKLILEKNLYGLDIDKRAYQLSYFALMMKARQYNRRIFSEDVSPQVYHPTGWDEGEEYGSLIRVDEVGEKPQEEVAGSQVGLYEDHERDVRIWNFKRLLAQKYDVVVTNPPYMGSRSMSPKMSDYVKKNYPDSKSDLFAAFIERCSGFLTVRGFQSMITMESWMFLSSFEKLRKKLFATQTFINMVHMPYLGKGGTSLGINFGTAAFIISKSRIKNYAAQYDYICYFETDDEGVPFAFPTINERYKASTAENFAKIPGSPVAYWVSEKMLNIFSQSLMSKSASVQEGLKTADNDRFIRKWHEIDYTKTNILTIVNPKWVRHTKGGMFRRWYGNNEDVLNYEDDGAELRSFKAASMTGIQNYYKQNITWSRITSGRSSFRYTPNGSIPNMAGLTLYANNNLLYILGYLNTQIVQNCLDIMNPTLNYPPGTVASIPFDLKVDKKDIVEKIVSSNISLSRADWDSFETSWDFSLHPLICGERTVAAAFCKWEREAVNRFNTLKANEEELNRIFINIYGLQDELTPEVEDKDVTVARIYDKKEDIPTSMKGNKYVLTKEDVVKSLISFAVGCMFGRYSLDVEGLAYAGGEWDATKYESFIPNKDNIIPISDDEYFEDDIVSRLVEFVRVVYGEETLEENLRFIADALGGTGTSREVIRDYFLKKFYKDHCQTYKKRPIYWLFDSGRKNGFKALIYLHRYQSDLLAKMRTDYVHEQQERYRTQLAHIATALNSAEGSERAQLLKRQDKLTGQAEEVIAFEEKIHHLADMNIEMDLDDGVKENYQLFADVVAKI